MHFRRKMCCLVITTFNLNCKTVERIKKIFQVLSFTFLIILLMNHLLDTYVCRRPHWWSPKRRARRTMQWQETYQAKVFPWLKEYTNDSHGKSFVILYCVLFSAEIAPIRRNFCCPKKYTYY